MREPELEELHDGDVIEFQLMNPYYGRAEFVVCYVFKRGRIVKVYITTMQQKPQRRFVIETNSDSLMVHSWTHKGLQVPSIWMHGWCKEHKGPYLNVYPPDGASKLKVMLGSTTTLVFDR